MLPEDCHTSLDLVACLCRWLDQKPSMIRVTSFPDRARNLQMLHGQAKVSCCKSSYSNYKSHATWMEELKADLPSHSVVEHSKRIERLYYDSYGAVHDDICAIRQTG